MDESFGNRIRDLRENKKLTQEELGKILGVKKQTISAWEKNIQETDFDMLRKLSDFFEVTIGFLLGKEN